MSRLKVWHIAVAAGVGFLVRHFLSHGLRALGI